MQTIFHFAGLSRCRDCLQLNQVKMSVRQSCACDFIRAKKWRIKLRTPQWDYETQRARRKGNGLLEAFSRTKILCLRQKKVAPSPSAVGLGCWSGFTDSLGPASQTVDTTPSFANPPRVTVVFNGHRSFQFCRRWTVTVGELVAAATTNWVVI